MEQEFVTRAAVYAVASPLIVALVQLAKGAGLPDRLAPAVALVAGIALALGAVAAVPDPPQHWFITGLIGTGLGLAAAGLYSGVRATVAPYVSKEGGRRL